MGSETGKESEQQAADHVDDERAVRELAAGAVLDELVAQIPRDRSEPGGTRHRQRQHQRCEDVLGPAGLPTYRITSTSSSITRPPVTSSSSVGRNASIRSGASTITIATGRSSDRLSSRVVCR